MGQEILVIYQQNIRNHLRIVKANQTQVNVLNQYCTTVKGENYIAQALPQRKGSLNLCVGAKPITAATTSLESVTTFYTYSLSSVY